MKRVKSRLSIRTKNILLIANSLIIVPATVASILFAIYHYFEVDKIFNDALSKSTEEKIRIAKIHKEESIQSMEADLSAIAEIIDSNLGEFIVFNKAAESAIIDDIARRFNISELICFTKSGVIAKTILPLIIPEDLFRQADEMEKSNLSVKDDIIDNKVRVIVKLSSTLNTNTRFLPDSSKDDSNIEKIMNNYFSSDQYINFKTQDDVYIIGIRYLNSNIGRYLKDSDKSSSIYQEMEELHLLRKRILIAFVCLSALLSILAIIILRKLINLIADPIDQTIDAISKINKGNLDTAISINNNTGYLGNYEMDIVMRSLNEMANKIFSQHNRIADMNSAQRKMIESLKLSTGMLLVNYQGKILITNAAASKILSCNELFGASISSVFHEIVRPFERYAKMLKARDKRLRYQDNEPNNIRAEINDEKNSQCSADISAANLDRNCQIGINNESNFFNENQDSMSHIGDDDLSYDIEYNIDIIRGGSLRHCRLYFTPFDSAPFNDQTNDDKDANNKENDMPNDRVEKDEADEHCILITFDDITEIIRANQLRVREDIARKVAHEVRNPLLPIQLSIERLEEKFSNQITKDRPLFERYIQTIINRVQDIKRIIDDFVELGQLSASHKSESNVLSIIEEVVLLQQNMYPHIRYIVDNKLRIPRLYCDKTQIVQVFTNILKNAAESISESNDHSGTIIIRVSEDDQGSLDDMSDNHENARKKTRRLRVDVIDDGAGLKSDYIVDDDCAEMKNEENNGEIRKDDLNMEANKNVKDKENNINNNNNSKDNRSKSNMNIGLKIVEKIIREHGGSFQILNCNLASFSEYSNIIDSISVVATFTIMDATES